MAEVYDLANMENSSFVPANSGRSIIRFLPLYCPFLDGVFRTCVLSVVSNRVWQSIQIGKLAYKRYPCHEYIGLSWLIFESWPKRWWKDKEVVWYGTNSPFLGSVYFWGKPRFGVSYSFSMSAKRFLSRRFGSESSCKSPACLVLWKCAPYGWDCPVFQHFL